MTTRDKIMHQYLWDGNPETEPDTDLQTALDDFDDFNDLDDQQKTIMREILFRGGKQ